MDSNSNLNSNNNNNQQQQQQIDRIRRNDRDQDIIQRELRSPPSPSYNDSQFDTIIIRRQSKV